MTDKISLYRFPSTHNLLIRRWNMLCWALSYFFSLHPPGTQRSAPPLKQQQRSPLLVPYIMFLQTPGKKDKNSPSCIISFVLPSRTQEFKTISIKNSLYPAALSSYIFWHFYQREKPFQSCRHSLQVTAIFLKDFRQVMPLHCLSLRFWCCCLSLDCWNINHGDLGRQQTGHCCRGKLQ